MTGRSSRDDEYYRMVLRGPRPTEEQIRQFAAFASDDHSWYKHLPLTGKGEPFVLYLAPHVHEVFVDTDSGVGEWGELIEDDSKGGFIPRWAVDLQKGDIAPDDLPPMAYFTRGYTTERYRRLYDRWSYWNFGAPGEERLVSLSYASAHLRVHDDHGHTISLPDEVIERGLVYLRATVSPGLGPMSAEYERLREAQDLPLAHDDRAIQIETMVMAMQDVVAWIYDEAAGN